MQGSLFTTGGSVMNHLTIILKPTNQCNANCLYCSAWDPGEKNKIMSEKTLEILFERIEEWVRHSKRTRKIKIIWHGGEPTLMPLDFFYKTIDLEKKIKETHGLEIENNIQSNLLYLDQEKLEMLKRLLAFNGQKRTIGTSFEPLPGIRIIKNGDYTTEWEKSIELLKKNNFPFGIVYVVHRRSLDEFDTLVETFLKKFPQTGIRFNPLYREGRALNRACQSLYITPLEWGDFLVKLYRIWDSHNKKPGWQPLKEMDAFHFKKDSRACCDLAGKCGTTHLGIDTDGTVYSCGRGIDRKYNSYGNIHQKRISEILTSPSRMAMTNRPAFLENTYCHGCKWWQYCHGGCPMDAAINNNNDIFKKSNFCLSRQRFLEAIYKEPFVEKNCCSQQ
jgi:uncharacterized protein